MEATDADFEHTLEKPVQISYHPPDNEFNIWMYAMIALGCAFVVFVVGSVYLMCNSKDSGQSPPLRRHCTSKTAISRGNL